MQLMLNIYKNSREIEKSYEADTYDLMFGTIEDIMSLLDGFSLDEDGNEGDLLELVKNGMGMLKPFLKDIFPYVTDEELRMTKVKELVPLFIDIFKFAFSEIKGTATKKVKKQA